MGLFSFGRRSKVTIDWDSPDLAPINGVSLQTFVQVTTVPARAGTWNYRLAAMAAEAGVSVPAWTEARLAWQARLTSNVMVQNAMSTIMDPDFTGRRTYGV